MADISDTLKTLLGDNAEDKLKDVLGSLSQEGGAHDELPSMNTDGLGEVMQLKSMLESMTRNRNDPRSNLLMSLRPYMSDERKQSIDSAVRLMGIMNLIRMLGK